MESIINWLLNLTPGATAGKDVSFSFGVEFTSTLKFVLLIALVVGVGFIIQTYRKEGDVPKRKKAFLAGVRIFIALLLLFAALKPALATTTKNNIYRKLIILVDDSISMNFNDKYLPGDKSNIDKAKLAELTDRTEYDVEKTSRLELTKIVMLKNLSMLKSLNKSHDIELYKFSNNAPGKEPYLSQLAVFKRNSKTLEAANKDAPGQFGKALAKLTAKGYETDLADPLRSIAEINAGFVLGAVVVISDGQQTIEDAMPQLTRATAYTRKIPRIAVLVGDTTEPRNVHINSFSMPKEIRAGVPVSASVELNQRNVLDEKIAVKLFRQKVGKPWPADWKKRKPLAQKSVTFKMPVNDLVVTKTTKPKRVDFEIIPDETDKGDYFYRVLLEAKNVQERTYDDNQSQVLTNISDKKIRILLVSADAGWEFRFLRNYFLRHPKQYQISVWQQDADPEVNQSASTGMKLMRLPRSLKELIKTNQPEPSEEGSDSERMRDKDGKLIPPGYDVVVLYDPKPTKDSFDPAFVKNLSEFVTKHRGGLCYIAGNKNTITIFNDEEKKYQALVDLLPVVLENPEPSAENDEDEFGRPKQYSPKLAVDGINHPITRLNKNVGYSQHVWNAFPGVQFSLPVHHMKPNARILVQSSNPAFKMTMTAMPAPLVAVHSAGAGRVVYMGTDETWRWRTVRPADSNKDAVFYRKFWSNLVRYLAPLHARRVVFSTSNDKFGLNEKIRLVAEVYDEDYKPEVKKYFNAQLQNLADFKDIRKIKMSAIPNKPGFYEAFLTIDEIGKYRFIADPKELRPEMVETRMVEIFRPRDEDKKVEANIEAMRKLATPSSSDRNLLNITQFSKIESLINHKPIVQVSRQEHSLWDTPLIWILLMSLLLVEWIARKLNRMM